MLNMLAGDLHQLIAVADQDSHRTDIGFRSKRASQQPHRVQILQPLTFMPIGAPSWHILHVSCIDQARLQPALFQNIVERESNIRQ